MGGGCAQCPDPAASRDVDKELLVHVGRHGNAEDLVAQKKPGPRTADNGGCADQRWSVRARDQQVARPDLVPPGRRDIVGKLLVLPGLQSAVPHGAYLEHSPFVFCGLDVVALRADALLSPGDEAAEREEAMTGREAVDLCVEDRQIAVLGFLDHLARERLGSVQERCLSIKVRRDA